MQGCVTFKMQKKRRKKWVNMRNCSFAYIIRHLPRSIGLFGSKVMSATCLTAPPAAVGLIASNVTLRPSVFADFSSSSKLEIKRKNNS